MKIDYSPLSRKLEELIKEKIKIEGLVKSGKLLGSIKVDYKDDEFVIEGVDYFKYLNADYDILQFAVNSKDFTDFTEKYLSEEIEKSFKDLK